MKKILLSLLSVVAIGSVATAATTAYFSDTEVLGDNTFSAGTLDLKTNDVDGLTHRFTLTNLKRGSWDLAGSVNLKNAGTINGKLWYEIVNVRNTENDCLEPELEALDTTCDTGDDQGELGAIVKASLQENVSPWTRHDTGVSIDASQGTHVDIGNLNAGAVLPVVMYGTWHPGTVADDNQAMGDSVTFDVVFHLEQPQP